MSPHQNPASNPAFTSSLLEIKNWTKYQKPNTTTWIKDYTNREDDLAFGKLTVFQRGLLEGICRLRARQARPIPNDPAYISRALQIIATERRDVPQALQALIASGFLIPLPERDDTVTEAWADREPTVTVPWHDREGTVSIPCDVLDPQNEQVSFSKSHRLEKIREEESRGEEKEQLTLSNSKATPETHGQDEARDQAFVQLALDEQEVLSSIPTPVVEFVDDMAALPCPLNTEDYPNDSPVILPWTEPAGYLSEASTSENYDLACTALSFTKNPARMFLDYSATFELDRLYGNGKSIELAEVIAEHCPKHRGFIYSYLADSLIRRTECCTENGQPDAVLAS